MKVTIDGLAKLKQQINGLSRSVEDGYKNATDEILNVTRDQMVTTLIGNTKYSDKYNQDTVKVDSKLENGAVVHDIFTFDETAIYKEFGTGQVGQNSKKVIPDGFALAYTQKPRWFFPVSSVSQDLTELYGMVKVKIAETEFYITNGQPARPWFYVSFLEVMEHSEEIYKRHIEQAIRKGL